MVKVLTIEVGIVYSGDFITQANQHLEQPHINQQCRRVVINSQVIDA